MRSGRGGTYESVLSILWRGAPRSTYIHTSALRKVGLSVMPQAGNNGPHLPT